MGITVLIVFVLAIAGAVVWFFIKNKKTSNEEVINKPSEPVSEPSAPPVDEVPTEDEKDPEKPKFKVGDWIITNKNHIWYVDETPETTSYLYRLINQYGKVEVAEFEVVDEKARLWTIQDAKDGDVLCSGQIILLFEKWECSDWNFVIAYAGIDVSGKLQITNEHWLISNDVHPATKEQRDFLFQKMKEAGYEWDANKNELKKIEDAPKPPVVEEKPKYDEEFESYINKYSQFAKIERDSSTYKWFYELFREAKSQLRIDTCHGLPILLKKENFPTLYEWGDKGDVQKAQDTLIGWLFSLQLAELKPYYRADIFKLGYELGGYDRYSNIYGYKFELDPNVMRILAGAIYPAMKGYCKPVTETMRKEVEGTMYGRTLKQLYTDEKRDNVSPSGFFTDFRVFLPTAPAPYLSTYSKRSDRTYPNEPRDEYDNLKIDRQIHEMIVEAYNLNQPEHYQEVVQAIADKEAKKEHLFGKNVETKHYHFHPVFGEDTIGMELPYDGVLGDFAYLCLQTGSASRAIMQSATITPPQYGRLRPGCSWTREEKKNSKTDDRRNVLTNFEIEDGDGSPTGYYDKNGNWIYMNGINNPSEFEEFQKNHLYANSYPSGHSSGIFCAAMLLMELFPNLADRILKAANWYSLNRTICRYHHTSDTINGRVLGSATNAICHAASDYYKMLKTIEKELSC